MKYLLIAVLIFVVGCSDLSEEKVYSYDLDWVNQKATVSTKYIQGDLKFKFEIEQQNDCNWSKDMDNWIILFRDKDGFNIKERKIYEKNMVQSASNKCFVRYQGSETMKSNTYKLITSISVSTRLKNKN